MPTIVPTRTRLGSAKCVSRTPPTAALPASATSAWIETERSKVIMGGAQRRPDFAAESGEGRNRTGDTTVFSRVLYQLSYLA